MNKRGMSGVVVTVLLIALSLAAVAIVWVVVSNLINNSLADTVAGSTPIILSINEGSFKTTPTGYSLKIDRTSGEGPLSKIRLVLTDSKGDDYSTELETTMKVSEGRTFDIDLASVFGDGFNGISTIKVIPIITLDDGKEKELGVTDTFKVASLPVTAKDNLVAEYPLDGSAVDVVGGHDGVLGEDTIDLNYQDSERGTVGEFGYSGDQQIVAPSNGVFGGTDLDYSVSGWIKTSSNSKSKIFGYQATQPGKIDYCALNLASSTQIQYHCEKTDDGPNNLNSDSNLEQYFDGKWHQVIVTREARTKIKIYLDGKKVGEGDDFGTSEFNSAGKFYIGGPYTETVVNQKRYIDDVKVFNKALSENEVKMLYQEGLM